MPSVQRAPLRDVPAQAVDLIKAFEGIPDGDPSTVLIDPYLCPADVWTIGWGHAITEGGVQLKGSANRARAKALFPGGITRAQAEALLAGDLIPRAAVVARLCKVALNEGQFGALIALLYNIGEGNLAASTLLRRLNQGDVAAAAEQFLVWDKARVKGVLTALRGLTRRRRAERAMFLGEDWRAAGELGLVTRGRAEKMEVLPVPEAPEADRPKKAAVKKAPARKTVVKTAAKATQAAAKKAAAKGASAERAPGRKVPAKKVLAKKAASKKPAPARR